MLFIHLNWIIAGNVFFLYHCAEGRLHLHEFLEQVGLTQINLQVDGQIVLWLKGKVCLLRLK